MIKLRALYILIVAMIILSVAGCSGSVWEELPTHKQSSIVKEGDAAPLFTATLIDGGEVSLAEYRGEALMLILFSHTCSDCKALFDDLHHLIANGTTLPAILAIGRDATTEDLLSYRADNNYSIDMVADSQREIFNLYATTYVPRVYIVDASGTIVMMRIEYQPHYLAELIECANAL